MSTDAYRDLLFNDGEGITHADLNNARAFLGARVFDQLIEHEAGAAAVIGTDPDLWSVQGEDTVLTSLVYTLTGGDGVLKVGSAATKIGTYGGTIFQKIANADGEEANFIPFTMGAGEFDLTIGAGDATNPRIDIVQVKLEYVEGGSESRDFKDAVTGALSTTTPNKTRRAQATFSLKAGTPAATPTYPAPDAGYAVLGAVRVPATWTTGVEPDYTYAGGTTAKIRQCSIPLKTHSVTVMGSEMDTEGAGGAGTPNKFAGFIYADGGDLTNVFCWCPIGGPGTRIVGITLHGNFPSGGGGNNTAVLRNYTLANGGGSFSIAAIYDATLTSVLITNENAVWRSRFAHLGMIADAMTDSNPSAANGPVGDGVWVGGSRSGPAYAPIKKHAGSSAGDQGWLNRAALVLGIEADGYLVAVTFHLAG